MTRLVFNPHRRPGYRTAGASRDALALHRRLPGYEATPLHRLDVLASELRLRRVWLKDESRRLGLPAFKVLGASWAIYRAVCERLGREPAWDGLDGLRAALTPIRPLTLATATDGNHGRAVAHVAALLGFEARVFVPAGTAAARIEAIEGEGARVTVVPGDYDDAVALAAAEAGPRCIVVSDTAWDGYKAIPEWVIEGYSTIFREVDRALAAEREPPPNVVIVQIGVGALAAAVVTHFRARDPGPTIVGVEPESAACVLASIAAGRIVTVAGPHDSMMAGLNCGTPSLVAWPAMRDGIDAFVALDDARAVEGMRVAAAAGVVSGETGAAGLGALLELASGAFAEEARLRLGLGPQATALVISTEGDTDPQAYERLVGRTAAAVRGEG